MSPNLEAGEGSSSSRTALSIAAGDKCMYLSVVLRFW